MFFRGKRARFRCISQQLAIEHWKATFLLKSRIKAPNMRKSSTVSSFSDGREGKLFVPRARPLLTLITALDIFAPAFFLSIFLPKKLWSTPMMVNRRGTNYFSIRPLKSFGSAVAALCSDCVGNFNRQLNKHYLINNESYRYCSVNPCQLRNWVLYTPIRRMKTAVQFQNWLSTKFE